MSTSTFSRESVEARLAELRDVQEEIARLERVLEVWDAPKAGRGGRPRGTSATATRTRRAARGSRSPEFLEAVTDVPGISAKDLHAEMEGCNLNYIYRIANDLIKEGKIVKRGQGYYLASADPAPDTSQEMEIPEEDGDPDEYDTAA